MKKYFIDFEATQFTNEIISVGCICEDGSTFYSLIKPQGKITTFIEKLTNLSKKDILSANSADKVFKDFYNFLVDTNPQQEKPRFFVYGSSDKSFVESTLKRVSSWKSTTALSLIYGNIKNYSLEVKSILGLAQEISIIEIIKAIRGNYELTQKHNALEDACFLKEIYAYCQNKNRQKIEIPDKYYHPVIKKQPKTIDTTGFVYTTVKYDKTEQQTFNNIKEAVEWTIQKYKMKNVDKNKVANRIVQSCLKRRSYGEYYWNREEKNI